MPESKGKKIDTNKLLEASENEESRILVEREDMIMLDDGNDYKIKATFKKVGGWLIVAVDWEHPNYGYFADAMLWYKSMHLFSWQVIHIVEWSKTYKVLDDFLLEYPEFGRLFDHTVSIFSELTEQRSKEVVDMLRKHGLNEHADALENRGEFHE